MIVVSCDCCFLCDVAASMYVVAYGSVPRVAALAFVVCKIVFA